MRVERSSFDAKEFCMQRPDTPIYLEANPADVGSLVYKLTQFSQQLSEIERALFLERIRRDLINAELGGPPIPADPASFAAWINAILADGSRWYPS
jgi:hypothetical protein